jgi:hypothetical protein
MKKHYNDAQNLACCELLAEYNNLLHPVFEQGLKKMYVVFYRVKPHKNNYLFLNSPVMAC